LLKNSIMFEVFLSIYKFRVEREYPNPNPKLRVPPISGNTISGLTSANSFNYPNFSLPELPDPIGSGNPNAQSDLTQCPPPRAAAAMDGGRGGAVASGHHCAVYCWRIPSNRLWMGWIAVLSLSKGGRGGRLGQ
jgi:hypothetical protein